MKIQIGKCRCGVVVFIHKDMGLTWVVEWNPLESADAVAALLGGRELYRVTFVGSTPTEIQPATNSVLAALRTEPSSRPYVVATHGCPSAHALGLLDPRMAQGGRPAPAGPPVGLQAPSWAPPAVDPAAGVGLRASEGPGTALTGLLRNELAADGPEVLATAHRALMDGLPVTRITVDGIQVWPST